MDDRMWLGKNLGDLRVEGFDASDQNGTRAQPQMLEITNSIAATIYSVWRNVIDVLSRTAPWIADNRKPETCMARSHSQLRLVDRLTYSRVSFQRWLG